MDKFNSKTTVVSSTDPVTVIIIGAGPSGIAAGTKLYENGITNILWLEAENRIGGRINTQQFGANVIEYGAQWCHGEKDNVVYEMAYPLGLLEHANHCKGPEKFADIFTPSGIMLPKLEVQKVHQAIEEVVNDPGVKDFNGSLGDFMELKFSNKLRNDLKDIDENLVKYVLDWAHKSNSMKKAGDSLWDVSAKRSMDFWPCEGDDLNWKGRGFKTILDLMMKKLPDTARAVPLEDKILLNKEVVNIVWNTESLILFGLPKQSGVTVQCADGSEYKADYVIVTVSLGVLKDRINSLFYPQLPTNKFNAIQCLKMNTLNKLIFEFSQPWWPENHPGFTFAWQKNEIEEQLNKFDGSLDSNKWLSGVVGLYPLIDHQPNLLLGWMVGEQAQQMEIVPEHEVKSKVIQLARLFLGHAYNIPEPVNFTRSKWYSNPHFLGSCSCNTVEADRLNISRVDLEEPLINCAGKDVVLFAGEATSNHRFSSVHGAIESGWREANRILKLLKV